MKINKNYLLLTVLLFYTIFGSWLSIRTGISHDEYHEQLNWEINLLGIKSFFSTGEYLSLINYKDKYHGIAFHIISQPIQLFFSEFVTNLNEVSSKGGFLISKHIAIFFIFSISGIFFYLICLKISKDFYFSLVSTILYLIYPYLFGHAQINPKDIPFLSFWLINTYFFLIILENIYYRNTLKIRQILTLSLLTAFLISIRTLGILIFLEYLIGLSVLLNYKKFTFIIFANKYALSILIFLTSFLFFLFILNPIFWHNPLEFINSIKWMGKYQQNVCTLTLGKCLEALRLPASYYFIWLFFKLPILILLGILLFPIIEKKLFLNDDKIKLLFYLTLLLTIILTIIVFIIKKIALYDEIRHIMFLIPFIFLISLINIYTFNKKLFYIFTIPVILFFLIENLSVNPYQYTWLNSFAKMSKIEKNFEVDYWGISNKALQKEIIKYSKLNSLDKSICIFGDMYVKEFLIKKDFTCFKSYSELDSSFLKPFFVYKNVRNVKRSNPKDCELIFEENFKYSFSSQNVSAGSLWYCN